MLLRVSKFPHVHFSLFMCFVYIAHVCALKTIFHSDSRLLTSNVNKFLMNGTERLFRLVPFCQIFLFIIAEKSSRFANIQRTRKREKAQPEWDH